MAATLDTSKAHLVRRHGDITVIFTWMNDERAMILLPSYRPKSPWYVVMESAAYKYDDPRYLARQCPTACDVLGIEPSTKNWSRIAGIIHDGLPDLIRMPSQREEAPRGDAYGAMKLFADGKQIAEEAIINEIQEGAMYA